MKKDLQAFEQLKELASGKNRPHVQWLSLEEKKSKESKTDSNVNPRCSSNSRKSGSSHSSSSSSRGSVKASFLQETGKKDDRILEAQTDQSLRNLSQARLRALLSAQQRLADSALCKKLPDGGAKIMLKLAQIQSALDYVIHVDALVLGLEINMSLLKLDEKQDTKRELDVDPNLRDHVARKVQLAQRAKMPYSQASLAIKMTPDGTFRGVNPKYRSGAPKFLTLAEADELNRSSRQAIALQSKEHPSAVIGSQGSAFHTAHWHQPDADFSSEQYREPTSDFDDEENDEESEHDDEDDEDEGDPPAFMHLRPSPIADMLV